MLTDAVLTKPQATRIASVAHDGMARAISPLHLMVDGDAVFCLASNRRPLDPRFGGLLAFNALLVAAADVFTDACMDALLSADSRETGRATATWPPPYTPDLSRRGDGWAASGPAVCW